MLALGPGSLRLDPGGPLHGRITSAGFRRGVVELQVDVEGVGRLTVVEPSRGRSADQGIPAAGGAVRLAPVPGGVARLG